MKFGFPALKASFAKAGGGKKNSFFTSKQALPSLPSFYLCLPEHMLIFYPLFLQSSWLCDQAII